MPAPDPSLLLPLALAIEAACGYPNRLYAAIGHPVTWMGSLTGALDRVLNRETAPFAVRRGLGIVALIVLLAVAGAGAVGLGWALARHGWLGFLLSAIAASTLLAQRSLHEHVERVADALEREGLDGGRQAVSMIVGRNPMTLDEAGVSRAAIESLAENFSDGVVAPAFWLTVGGLPGIALYKAINTADSMIGHRTPRHLAFGWAAARLDDLVNLPASRLAGLLIAGAGALQSLDAGKTALEAGYRDAGRHRSPNAGWPEAAMAGALGLKLAGPRIYGDTRVEDHWMGDGRVEADAADIRRALAIYRRACALLWLVALLPIGFSIAL